VDGRAALAPCGAASTSRTRVQALQAVSSDSCWRLVDAPNEVLIALLLWADDFFRIHQGHARASSTSRPSARRAFISSTWCCRVQCKPLDQNVQADRTSAHIAQVWIALCSRGRPTLPRSRCHPKPRPAFGGGTAPQRLIPLAPPLAAQGDGQPLRWRARSQGFSSRPSSCSRP